MNRPDLYNKTVDILYQSYFNDTLEHGNTCACAVGNLIMHGLGYHLIKETPFYKRTWENESGQLIYPSSTKGWPEVFLTETTFREISRFCPNLYAGEAKRQIDATGYPFEDLAKIEKAFELADRGNNAEDYNFNGLVAVLDVLAKIHEVTDQDLISNNSKRFSDHYKILSPCPATNAII